ncbi:uncharacterized protein CANTADRAFT_89627 [Suhomyces tanzawaensis NRRL Y-17324]|uniref:Uncharacterized protein n=1 Tax=Suhomyces tanzawaensis NRRL Y-17324 TaxID=984487 RepID=A0A1E4SKS0_9ASCO|nr:uncharacterized protein CANTADRAFT_89627 [Suhomyces tanzawaensis NRRL Y-17324]ODV80037.1 hypothetical protein CANTADRAFT_89627 [Suhomyces tanzawaensis NRRL Y-17324]
MVASFSPPSWEEVRVQLLQSRGYLGAIVHRVQAIEGIDYSGEEAPHLLHASISSVFSGDKTPSHYMEPEMGLFVGIAGHVRRTPG